MESLCVGCGILLIMQIALVAFFRTGFKAAALYTGFILGSMVIRMIVPSTFVFTIVICGIAFLFSKARAPWALLRLYIFLLFVVGLILVEAYTVMMISEGLINDTVHRQQTLDLMLNLRAEFVVIPITLYFLGNRHSLPIIVVAIGIFAMIGIPAPFFLNLATELMGLYLLVCVGHEKLNNKEAGNFLHQTTALIAIGAFLMLSNVILLMSYLIENHTLANSFFTTENNGLFYVAILCTLLFVVTAWRLHSHRHIWRSITEDITPRRHLLIWSTGLIVSLLATALLNLAFETWGITLMLLVVLLAYPFFAARTLGSKITDSTIKTTKIPSAYLVGAGLLLTAISLSDITDAITSSYLSNIGAELLGTMLFITLIDFDADDKIKYSELPVLIFVAVGLSFALLHPDAKRFSDIATNLIGELISILAFSATYYQFKPSENGNSKTPKRAAPKHTATT